MLEKVKILVFYSVKVLVGGPHIPRNFSGNTPPPPPLLSGSMIETDSKFMLSVLLLRLLSLNERKV